MSRESDSGASVWEQDGRLSCQGAWTVPHLATLEKHLKRVGVQRGAQAVCDASGITALDTGGAVFLHRALAGYRQQGWNLVVQGLRPEFTELFHMVETHWSSTAVATAARMGWLERCGRFAWGHLTRGRRMLEFLGENTVVMGRSLLVPTRIRWRALVDRIEQDGVQALPITGLLTFLIGVVIAYQGAEQLRKFGTNIFIVDLVGISLLREIAPLIVAILIAGRSGSAYTAEIGTMQVTEELDAVRALGISPISLLVLPRALALVVAMPLLTVYADAFGVFGGMLIASTNLNVSFTEFVARFEEAVALRHFLIGVGKSVFFAMIIALVGCYQGFQIRGGVDDVGRYTTLSVVQSIFLVIVFDAICSILLNWWHL